MRRRINSFYFLLLILFVIIQACSFKNSKTSINDHYLIKIFSPYNCEYYIEIIGVDVDICAKSQFPDPNDSTFTIFKSRINRYDTIIPIIVNKDITKQIGEINFKSNADSTKQRDSYFFEVYVNSMQVLKQRILDSNLYYVLNKLQPYIKTAIQCCVFFLIIDEFKPIDIEK